MQLTDTLSMMLFNFRIMALYDVFMIDLECKNYIDQLR